MDLEHAINQHKEDFQVILNAQRILFSDDLNINDFKQLLPQFITTRDKLLPILLSINEIGFARPYPPSFFNELFSILSASIRTHFTSDEVASIFSKSTKNYIPLFHCGCLNIETIINRSYLSDGVFKMFHIVIAKHDPIYYQIRLQKATPSLKTFILNKDTKARETINAIQADNCDQIQTVHAQTNLSLSSKIPFASSQINDGIKHAWQMPSMLEYAAMQGSLDTFKYLLLNGAEITENLSSYAIRGGSYEIIHIVEKEGRIQFKDSDMITAVKYNRNNLADYLADNYNKKHSLYSLFEAFDDYNIEYFLNHFQLLNELNELNPKTATVNYIEMWHQKRSLLHIAAKNGFTDFVRLLLDVDGIDINLKSALDGFSPLHEAASSGFIEVVKMLADKGANVAQLSYKNMTPLHLAAMNGYSEIVNFLITSENSMINQKDSDGNTALHLAAKNGFDKIVDYLIHHEKITVINDRNNDTFSPLACAINNCRINVVDVLCSSEKVDVNLGDFNRTPLQMAVIQNVLPLVAAILSKSGQKLDVNASNGFNTNALQQALKLGYNDIAMLLLDHPRIDVSVKNNDNRNVLSYASETGNIQIVRKILALLSNEKKCEVKNEATSENENKKDEDENVIDNKNDNENDIKNDNCDNNNDNITNENEENNDNENDIIENHININDSHAKNESYNNSICDEQNKNNENHSKEFDINDADFFGQTALHLAAKNGHFEIMKLLIDAGIDKNKRNSIFSKIFNNILIPIYITFH